MATTSPIKVDEQTDKLISDAAHFLGRTKKDIVEEAVRGYVQAHRAELDAGVKEALSRLDGSNASVVAMMTGFSREKLQELGGVPER